MFLLILYGVLTRIIRLSVDFIESMQLKKVLLCHSLEPSTQVTEMIIILKKDNFHPSVLIKIILLNYGPFERIAGEQFICILFFHLHFQFIFSSSHCLFRNHNVISRAFKHLYDNMQFLYQSLIHFAEKIYLFISCIPMDMQIYLLAAKPSNFVTIMFRIQMNYLNGPLLAFLFPETDSRQVVMEATVYWIQHGLMFIIPVYLLRLGGVYTMEPLSDISWNVISYSICLIYHFVILEIFALVS